MRSEFVCGWQEIAKPVDVDPVDATLDARETVYGNFAVTARVSMAIKEAFASGPRWEDLSPVQKHALDMVATKLGRVLSGDVNHLDSWHDAIGYLRLVEKDLTTKVKET